MKPFLIATHRAKSAPAGIAEFGISEMQLKALQLVFSKGQILDWQTLRQIIRCIRDKNIDVIHPHRRKVYAYGTRAALSTGRPAGHLHS